MQSFSLSQPAQPSKQQPVAPRSDCQQPSSQSKRHQDGAVRAAPCVDDLWNGTGYDPAYLEHCYEDEVSDINWLAGNVGARRLAAIQHC
jgi:hypothetical protein